MEKPEISELQAVASAFTAAFNTALYELETSRRQIEERSALISELDASIGEIRAALDTEISKGRSREEEYTRMSEQLQQQILGLQSERDALQEKLHEQDGISTARAEKINRLTARMEELDAALTEHATEAERAGQERDRLTAALMTLQAQFDTAADDLQAQQAELEQRNGEITGLRSQLDERDGDLHSKIGEISGLEQQLTELREELQVQSEAMCRQAEQHAHATEQLNTRAAEIGDELETLRAAHDELTAHAEKLETLNTALHESSITKSVIHKHQLDEKSSEIELLRTRLDTANASSAMQSDRTLESENQLRALNDLKEKLQAAEAQKQILESKARLAEELEPENERLRAALEKAAESAAPGEEDAQRLKALQAQLADLQSMLDSSRSEQKTLAEQLHDYEQLKQEAASLRELVRQFEARQDEQGNPGWTLEAIEEEADKPRAALSGSEQKFGAGLSASLMEENLRQIPVDRMSDRTRFVADLDNLLVENHGSTASPNVMYILLDRFVQVRDEIGVMESEHVIKEVAEIIASICSGDDRMSRFGDCTFAMICSGESLGQTREKAEKIRAAIESRIFEYGGRSVIATASIGICSVRKGDSMAADVISRADLACEAARSYGGNQVLVSSTVSDKFIGTGAGDDHGAMIKAVLDERRARIYYQPISSLKEEQNNHYEILIRIIDENGSIILPGEFISMAGNCGYAAAVDRYVIENVMKIMAENRDQETTLFIKLTGQTVADQSFPLWVMHKIKEYSINPAHLVFEITENLLQSDIKNLSMLSKALNAVGCKIAIEHYRMSCQLHHLKHIHAYYLKIDGGLIGSIGRKGASLLKVAAIMKMAKENNYITIAEGVESSAALAILCELGVDMAQGYFIQAPAGSRDFNFQGFGLEDEQEAGTRAIFRIG